jgi:UDP-N-acetylmuramoyl-L-alanyl-D-glutamate--2,6-diaminopimelate ligase
MLLKQIIKDVEVLETDGNIDLEITGLAYDSRRVQPGQLFIALKGHSDDGHLYLKNALESGAAALVVEDFSGTPADVTKITVQNSREALSKMATAYYGYPFKGMNLIGITGTNGKTTTSYLIESVLSEAGKKTGVMGTINYRFEGNSYGAPVTTPESADIMALLRKMRDAGVSDVVMEVSSHALHQGRTGDCPFARAVFTNFSRDHLDYHENMDEYFEAKSLLFKGLGGKVPGNEARAIINLDDPKGRELATLTKVPVTSYGLTDDADIRAKVYRSGIEGIEAQLMTSRGIAHVASPLVGEFNVYNILAAVATALSMGVSLAQAVRGIEKCKKIPGRLEVIENSAGLRVVVDYAHTPDALLNVLKTLRPMVEGRIFTVFGCGGDRDKGKRYDMGLIAGEQSDLVIITSDNPRTENPEAIIEQIRGGVIDSGLQRLEEKPRQGEALSGYLQEQDRRRAIQKAVTLARVEDLILVAGKGHEDYQIIGTDKRHFDDREEIPLAVNEKMKCEKANFARMNDRAP